MRGRRDVERVVVDPEQNFHALFIVNLPCSMLLSSRLKSKYKGGKSQLLKKSPGQSPRHVSSKGAVFFLFLPCLQDF